MNKFESVPNFGSVVATFSLFELSEWASIFGILFGFATLLIHLYYKRKEFELKKIELEWKLQNEKNKQN